MKYFAHIFVGNEFAEIASNIGKQVSKYGGGKFSPSINLFLVDGKAIKQITYPEQPVTVKQIVDKEDLGVEWKEIESFTGKIEEDAQLFRNNIFNQIIKIENVGINGELNVMFHFPLYKAEAMKQAESLYAAFKASERAMSVDFVGYCDDMAGVLEPEYKIVSPSKKQVAKYARFREEQKLGLSSHFIAIANSSQSGIALNLNQDSLSRIIGHFAMLCPEHYQEIFPNTIEHRDVMALGVSTLCLDKYLYAEYLLNKALLNAMDHKGVNGNDANVNTAYTLADPIFRDGKTKLEKTTLLSTVFSEIDKQNKIDTDAEFQKIDEKFKEEIQKIIDCRNEVLSRQEAITMQAAILAVCLAQTDCELFTDTIFSQNAVTLDKLFEEPIDYFIGQDRAHFYYATNDDGEEFAPINPIQEIRELDIKLLNSETQIRNYKERIDTCNTEIEESDKVIDTTIEGNNIRINGKQFRLLPSGDQEPLEATYTPHEVKEESIDLRSKFTPIKNQGQQGSCLSFTLTSIFEYMMKLSGQEDCDLSEAFLYYNARYLDGAVQEDNGSKFKPSIDSLQKFGIATEAKWPYNDKVYDEKPNEAAYQDAANRKLKMAMNVNHKVNDIKSALVDGCPVACSFVLTKSFFEMKGGYVPMPSEEEIAATEQPETEQNKHGRHAMVIVGFSDELKAFIVRNSWGADWGENGYCFIPYTYIEHEKLFNFACIITEIENMQKPSVEIIPLKINTNDIYIKRAIALNSLAAEEELVKNMRQRKAELRIYFEDLKARFGNANNRDAFITANTTKIEEEINVLKEQKKEKLQEYDQNDEQFNAYKKSIYIHSALFVTSTLLCSAFWWQGHNGIFGSGGWTAKTVFAWGLIFFGIAILNVIFRKSNYLKTFWASFGAIVAVLIIKLVNTVLGVFSSSKDFFEYFDSIGSEELNLGLGWLLGIFGVALGFLLWKGNARWKLWREDRHRIDCEIEELGKQIKEKEREKNLFRLKSFAAWSLLVKLQDLYEQFHNHYTQLVSLINNLRVWYKIIDQEEDECSVDTTTPDISLLDKDKLDVFFETELKENPALQIDFCEDIASYENNPEALAKYRKEIIERIVNSLMVRGEIKDFDISQHILNNNFSAIANQVDRSLVTALKERSSIFLEVRSLERAIITPSELVFAPSLSACQGDLSAQMRISSLSSWDDKYRLIYLQTSTLSFNECVNLKFE